MDLELSGRGNNSNNLKLDLKDHPSDRWNGPQVLEIDIETGLVPS